MNKMAFGKKKKSIVEGDGYEEEPEIDEIEEQVESVEEPVRKKRPVKKQAAPTERYTVFNIASRVGIIDSESKEIIAEGELAVLQILANMKEQLERIEKTIGDIIEE